MSNLQKYLTNDPQITFWKAPLYQLSNFQSFSRHLYFESSLDFGGESVCYLFSDTVSTIGNSMLNNIILELVLPDINLIPENSISPAISLYLNSVATIASRISDNIDSIMQNNSILTNIINDLTINIQYATSQLNILTHILDSPYLIHVANMLMITERIPYMDTTALVKYLETDFYQYYQELDKIAKIPQGFNWVANLAHHMIDTITIQSGNKTLDTHTGDWYHIYSKLLMDPKLLDSYQKMIGNRDSLVIPSYQKKSAVIYLPLQFWFCQDISSSIPLMAVHDNDITITVKLNPVDKLFNNTTNTELNLSLTSANLIVNYYTLDDYETKIMAVNNHIFVMPTLQYHNILINNQRGMVKFQLSDSTKFLIWYFKSGSRTIPATNIKLFFGNDKMAPEYPEFYSQVQQTEFFNGFIPNYYCYSFARLPADIQPSGSANLGQINVIMLMFQLEDIAENIQIYAVSNNILSIKNGAIMPVWL
jgi:hypothetical protein